MPTETPITTEQGEKVGVLRAGVLYIEKTSRDIYTWVGGNGSWSLPYEVFVTLPPRGSVEITTSDTKKRYAVRVGAWKEYGTLEIIQTEPSSVHVYICLPLEYFIKSVLTT